MAQQKEKYGLITRYQEKWAAELNEVLTREINDPEKVRTIHRFEEDENFGLHFLNVLNTALQHDDPSLLSQYLTWAESTFKTRNITVEALDRMIQQLYELIRSDVSKTDREAIVSYLEEAERLWEQEEGDPESYLDEDQFLGSLAIDYFNAVIEADRSKAFQLIEDAVNEQDVSVKDIYLYVFQAVQYEIGRLWQLNQISVAQEHFTTAVTQMAMSKLYPHIFASEKNGYRMIAASLGDELHEIGIRMVADFFEMDGWDTYYIGANEPVEDLLNELNFKTPHLLALSVTMTRNIQEAEDLITRIRNNPAFKNLKILVGGYPFSVSETLWEDVGADGSASDAQQAIQQAHTLIGQSN